MWFKGSNGLYYNDEDIKMAAYIADGIDIKGDDNVESYALTCKGILRECEPTVDDLIKSGQRAKAVILYRRQHSGVSFLDAKNFVMNSRRSLSETAIESRTVNQRIGG